MPSPRFTPGALAALVRGRLIVSCQALPDEPLYGSSIMARMALAAAQGGAAAIRANTPEDIAAMLVQAHRAKLPVPESLVEHSDSAPPERRERLEGVWFRIDVGRQHNADPRWLLPLLCRRGHITKSEVGAIRIAPNETLFEIHPAAAQRFLQSVKRTAGKDDNDVTIEPAPEGGPMRGGAPGGPHRHRRAGPPPQRRGPGPRR